MPDNPHLILRDFLSQRYGELRRRLLRILGNEALADDALHDTWLRLQHKESEQQVLNPRAFLTRMAVNIAINNLRSQSRAVPGAEIEELLEVADTEPGPEQTVASRQHIEMLSEVLARMPQRRRDILVMVRLDGVPQKEVAARLGVSLRTVEHELRRAHEFCIAQMHKKL
jgi:RNA polymerase sigma factor (sigma-70 family)